MQGGFGRPAFLFCSTDKELMPEENEEVQNGWS
jgi:hypothetical protein